MNTATYLLAGGVVVAWYAFRTYQKHRDDQRNAQFDLRYVVLDETAPDGDTFSGEVFVDFEQMLLVNQFGDHSYRQTRVCHLRRLDGPLWQAREEDASRTRSRAHLDAARKRGWFSESMLREREAELKDLDWRPCGWSEQIEPKYQLFLRHRDPTAASFVGRMVENAVAADYVDGTERPSRRKRSGVREPRD